MLKQGFCAFGQYYQIEIVDEPALYERVFSTSMGYADRATQKPAEVRSGDKLPYVEVTLTDEIRLRKIAKMSWTDDILPPK